MLLEIVDADERPVPPGSIGRVIVTPFYNLAMPPDSATSRRSRHAVSGAVRMRPHAAGTREGPGAYAKCLSVCGWDEHLAGSASYRRSCRTGSFRWCTDDTWSIEFRYVPVADGQTNDLPALTTYLRAKLHPSVTVTL